MSAPACKSFWTWTSIAAIAIGLFVLWKLLAWLLRPVRAWIAETRGRAREREVADEETMARYKVDDRKLFSSPAEENVEQKIREALLKKKIDDQQRRHHQKTGDKKP
jgi:Sec-independent protein translocase protein TatA